MECSTVGNTNADIAGLGIICAFVVQGGLSVILSTVSVKLEAVQILARRDPQQNETVRVLENWIVRLNAVLEGISQTQILNGISLLIAALVQHDKLSLYHLHIVYDVVNLTGVSACAALVNVISADDFKLSVGPHMHLAVFTSFYFAYCVVFGVRLNNWDYDTTGRCYDTSLTADSGADHPLVDLVYLSITCLYMFTSITSCSLCGDLIQEKFFSIQQKESTPDRVSRIIRSELHSILGQESGERLFTQLCSKLIQEKYASRQQEISSLKQVFGTIRLEFHLSLGQESGERLFAQLCGKLIQELLTSKQQSIPRSNRIFEIIQSTFPLILGQLKESGERLFVQLCSELVQEISTSGQQNISRHDQVFGIIRSDFHWSFGQEVGDKLFALSRRVEQLQRKGLSFLDRYKPSLLKAYESPLLERREVSWLERIHDWGTRDWGTPWGKARILLTVLIESGELGEIKAKSSVLSLALFQFPLHTYMIFALRSSNEHRLLGDSENVWGFGQIVALVLVVSTLVQSIGTFLKPRHFDHKNGLESTGFEDRGGKPVDEPQLRPPGLFPSDNAITPMPIVPADLESQEAPVTRKRRNSS